MHHASDIFLRDYHTVCIIHDTGQALFEIVWTRLTIGLR